MTTYLPRRSFLPTSIVAILVAAGLGTAMTVPAPATLAASVRQCAPGHDAAGHDLAAQSGKIRAAATPTAEVQPAAKAREVHAAYASQQSATDITYVRCSRDPR